jgi:hypothetical protein
MQNQFMQMNAVRKRNGHQPAANGKPSLLDAEDALYEPPSAAEQYACPRHPGLDPVPKVGGAHLRPQGHSFIFQITISDLCL